MIIKTKHVDKKVLEENVWMKLKGHLYFGQSTRLPLSYPSRWRQCGFQFVFVSLPCSKETFSPIYLFDFLSAQRQTFLNSSSIIDMADL